MSRIVVVLFEWFRVTKISLASLVICFALLFFAVFYFSVKERDKKIYLLSSGGDDGMWYEGRTDSARMKSGQHEEPT
jgi:hypothetical protein